MWETDIDIHQIKEIRVKTTAYLGVGAIKKIDSICGTLKKKNIQKALVITGKSSYITSGAWNPIENALKKHDIQYQIYDGVLPNPEIAHVDEASKIGIEFEAQVVIGVGGGSAIDVAKSVAILLKYPHESAQNLYEFKFFAKDATPIIAINLTHGTGTEVDRFAVVNIPEKQYKPAISYDCIYPLYAIDDPKLMLSLSQDQTRYVTIDALNHILEACTTLTANPLSILLGKETVRLIVKYLPIVLEDSQNLEARYYLSYASLIAGTSFDNGLLHFTHALEHPLSAVKSDLTHGLGLAILLPAVLKEIYTSKANTLLDVLAPMIGHHTPETFSANDLSKSVETWLHKMGVTQRLSDVNFNLSDIDRLTDLAFETPGLEGLLKCAPIEATRDIVKSIYLNSL